MPIFIWPNEGNNYCLDGHGRLRVLNKEQLKFENTGFEVPVLTIPADSFKDAKTKLLKITSQYQTITQEGIDAYIAEAELNEAEIYEAVHYDALPMIGQEDEVDAIEDEPVEVDENAPSVSQPGEIYQLGRHRLMCGDSTNKKDLDKLMDGRLANLVFTDPPYMVDYRSASGMTYKSTKYGGDGGAIFNDDLDEDEAMRFYTDVCENLYNHSTDDCAIYWWYASRNQHINRAAFLNTGWHPSQTIIWVKESMIFSPGVDFHRMYEPCIFGWKKGNKHFWAKHIHDQKDVFNLSNVDFVNMSDIWIEKRDNTSTYIHPTQKPVSLSTRGIRYHSRKGDAVLDLFGGSGSTLMGAEQLGRDAYLMELDPKFVDACRKRFHKFHHDDNVEGWEEGTPAIK